MLRFEGELKSRLRNVSVRQTNVTADNRTLQHKILAVQLRNSGVQPHSKPNERNLVQPHSKPNEAKRNVQNLAASGERSVVWKTARSSYSGNVVGFGNVLRERTLAPAPDADSSSMPADYAGAPYTRVEPHVRNSLIAVGYIQDIRAYLPGYEERARKPSHWGNVSPEIPSREISLDRHESALGSTQSRFKEADMRRSRNKIPMEPQTKKMDLRRSGKWIPSGQQRDLRRSGDRIPLDPQTKQMDLRRSGNRITSGQQTKKMDLRRSGDGNTLEPQTKQPDLSRSGSEITLDPPTKQTDPSHSGDGMRWEQPQAKHVRASSRSRSSSEAESMPSTSERGALALDTCASGCDVQAFLENQRILPAATQREAALLLVLEDVAGGHGSGVEHQLHRQTNGPLLDAADQYMRQLEDEILDLRASIKSSQLESA